jgi:hypothetical protein
MKNNDKQCLQKEMSELRNVECKTEKDFTQEQQVEVQEKPTTNFNKRNIKNNINKFQ